MEKGGCTSCESYARARQPTRLRPDQRPLADPPPGHPTSPAIPGLKMRIHRLLTFLLPALLLGSIAPDTVRGQSVELDEGTFRLSVNGNEVGTESFSIRRSGAGDGAQVIATAEIRWDGAEERLELRPALQAQGSQMAVSAYQVKISGDRDEEIYVTLGDRRFHTKVISARGEQEREYRAQPGTILLDTGIAHQLYFLRSLLDAGEATFPVIVPREGRQVSLTLTADGRETIRIGGIEVEARRFTVRGGEQDRTVWFDNQGRVLQVDDRAAGYRAVREELPG